MIRLAPLLILAGCSLSSLELDSPLSDIRIGEPEQMPADACRLRIEGSLDVVLPDGASLLRCGPGAGPEPGPPPPAEAAGGAGSAPEQTPEAAPAPAPLAAIIEEAEGGGNLAYCDPAGLHIGDGIHLSDAERSAAICAALESAEIEASRVLGAEIFNRLGDVRRDTWVELCYWAPCAGFVRAAAATREGDWNTAADEVLRSTLPRTDIDRARRIARWLRTGERT